MLATEVPFQLPVGYRDFDGTLHKEGVMRLATAGDEILPLRDHRVQSNPSYLPIVILSRVIIKLGTLPLVDTRVIENLYSADFAFLRKLYDQINGVEEP